MKKNAGFGLLELVLVLALVGVIIVGVLQLYQRASSHSSVLQTTVQVKRLLEASRAWLSSKRQSDFSSHTSNFMPELLSGQWLESADEHTVWGGLVEIRGNATGGMVLTLSGMPAQDCKLLSRQFSGINEWHSSTCMAGSGRESLQLEFVG